MKILKKALLRSISLALSMVAFTVQAQETKDVEEATTKPRAVLFKVHDIKSIENTDGVITDCDFLVTFYNRTTDSLRQAQVDMGWTDTITARYTSENEEETATKSDQRERRGARNNDRNNIDLGEITTSVEMPALGSYKQATVKGSVKTEKCFLLLDNLNFNVASCGIIGRAETQNNNTRRNRVSNSRNTSECASLFQYVDSKNPEYYDEFKNISYSEQERLLSNEKAQDMTELESTYERIIKNFGKAESIVNSIK